MARKKIKLLASPKYHFLHYRRGAKARNYPFYLSLEQFSQFWKKNCYYCGVSIENIGIDRLDNKIGYTFENVVACCKVCNKMKNTMGVQEFMSQCKKISSFPSPQIAETKTMENILEQHQKQITGRYFRRINNLRKLGRFEEAARDLNRLAGIYGLWEIQKENVQSFARRGLTNKK